jgi:uncharacterized protein YycO
VSIVDQIEESVLKAAGKVQVEFRPPKVRACHCRRMMKEVQAGDIMCRKYSGHLTSAFIPGEFSHSGFVESHNYVLHSIGEGVGREDVLDFVKDCDGFIILRPEQPYSVDAALLFARDQVTKPYDFKFDGSDDKALFCHEFTARALRAGGLNIDPVEKMIGIMLRKVYLAEQFISDSRIRTIYRTEF